MKSEREIKLFLEGGGRSSEETKAATDVSQSAGWLVPLGSTYQLVVRDKKEEEYRSTFQQLRSQLEKAPRFKSQFQASQVFVDQKKSSQDRSEAALYLALHAYTLAQQVLGIQKPSSSKNGESKPTTLSAEEMQLSTEVRDFESEFEARNGFIQAGVYLEMHFALIYQKNSFDPYAPFAYFKEDIKENLDQHKLKDANGSYSQVYFYNQDMLPEVYHAIKKIINRPFSIDDLLQMRNTSIEISILHLYLEDSLVLSRDQYRYLAVHYPHFVVEVLVKHFFDDGSVRLEFIAEFPLIREMLKNTLTAFKRGVINSGGRRTEAVQQYEAYYDQAIAKIESIPVVPDQADKQIDARINEEATWFFWAMYNKNKQLAALLPKFNEEKLDAYVGKYKESPLEIFVREGKINAGEVSIEGVRKAYRKLCLIYSPDKRNAPGMPKESPAEKEKKDNILLQMNEAYALLSDPKLFRKEISHAVQENETDDTVIVIPPPSIVPATKVPEPSSAPAPKVVPLSETSTPSTFSKFIDRIGIISYAGLWAGAGMYVGVVGLGMTLAPFSWWLIGMMGVSLLAGRAVYGLLGRWMEARTLFRGSLSISVAVTLALVIGFFGFALNPFSLMALVAIGAGIVVGVLAYVGIQWATSHWKNELPLPSHVPDKRGVEDISIAMSSVPTHHHSQVASQAPQESPKISDNAPKPGSGSGADSVD